ncbi:unnamed protein product, partial [Adineta steineri]
MVLNKEEDSSIITTEELFSLVPIEKLNENDLKIFSFNLNSIRILSHINKNLIELINKCDFYREGIINADLFSYHIMPRQWIDIKSRSTLEDVLGYKFKNP